MGEGVLEGVFLFWEQTVSIEKLRRLEVCQATLKHFLGQLGNGLQQRQGYLRANHGGRLQGCFSSGGNRSIRAASTACTVAGTWMVGRACARR